MAIFFRHPVVFGQDWLDGLSISSWLTISSRFDDFDHSVFECVINNGNRTNRSAINDKIIRVITKSTDRVAGG